MGGSTVLFLMEVVYNTQHLPFQKDFAEKGMEFQEEFPGNRHWVLNTKPPSVVTGVNIIHFYKEFSDIWGLIPSTTKSKEKGGRAPFTDYTLEFTMPAVPELLGTTY